MLLASQLATPLELRPLSPGRLTHSTPAVLGIGGIPGSSRSSLASSGPRQWLQPPLGAGPLGAFTAKSPGSVAEDPLNRSLQSVSSFGVSLPKQRDDIGSATLSIPSTPGGNSHQVAAAAALLQSGLLLPASAVGKSPSTPVSLPGRLLVATQSNGRSSDGAKGDTVESLRGEVSELRGELDALRSLLGAPGSMHTLREEAIERGSAGHEAERLGGGPAAGDRLERLQRRKEAAELQLRQVNLEAQQLREELARCQSQGSAGLRASSRNGSMSDLHSNHSNGMASSMSMPMQRLPQPQQQQQHRHAGSPGRSAQRYRGGSPVPSAGHGSSHASDRQGSPERSRRATSAGASRGRSSSPPRGGSPRADDMDQLWCGVLRCFPQHPDWILVKDRPGVYRMGGPSGKKLSCRIVSGVLQVRVGGGWMAPVAFLERYGPAGMTQKANDATPQMTPSSSSRAPSPPRNTNGTYETPPSMERLLVPTKAWTHKAGLAQ
eukprot:TRINITY_DN11187_c0_g1_i1.p1 TRINITY_DN11187_c0_g1~~TRINITY_DN11187_c0_g1_i1.p1  ORF type:complete len:492 (+),score=91.36 TRINITY_DN11187_c0_g1_i1:130-1605(+)